MADGQVKKPRNDSKGIFSSPPRPDRRTPVPKQSLIPAVMRQEHEADHSATFIAKVKNALRFTSSWNSAWSQAYRHLSLTQVRNGLNFVIHDSTVPWYYQKWEGILQGAYQHSMILCYTFNIIGGRKPLCRAFSGINEFIQHNIKQLYEQSMNGGLVSFPPKDCHLN